MKIKPSPLVASFTGSAGEATAALWHGTNYLRKKVVPRNPQTAAQTAVRLALKRTVELWQSLKDHTNYVPYRAALTYAALTYDLPAYNLFTKLNRALEQAASELILLPDIKWAPAYGGPVGKVTSFAAAAGASGEIDLTWTKLHAAGYVIRFFARKAATNLLVSTNPGQVAESAEAASITGLTPGTSYQVYACLARAVDDRMGQSVVDTEPAGA